MRVAVFILILIIAVCAVSVSFAQPPANPPQPHRLYAPCPWTPWALPKDQGVTHA